MSEAEIVAIIAAAASIVAAAFGVIGASLGAQRAQRAAPTIQERLDQLERSNRALWLWSRELVDHIYQRKPPPPPNPPTGI